MVADQADAAMPGVTITATNQNTGRVRTTLTTDQGTYRLDGITPGRYIVKAELPGFTIEERELMVAGTAVVTVDITMSVSSLNETVDVVATADLVDVTQNQIKTQMGDAVIQAVPVNGRRFQDLAFLAPGVSVDYGSTRAGTTDAIAFFGFNERYKSIYVDGVDLNDELTGGGTGISDAPRAQISMEAIEEVEVVRNQFSAEVGRQQAGVINIITKSGTNEYHGRAFTFFRDDSFDKKNAFATGTLPFQQTQAGANIGGPIARNKSHFFVSYELWDSEQVSTIRIPPALVDWLPDPRTELPLTNNRNNVFGKLTHSFAPTQVLNVTYLYDRQKAEGQAAASDSAADARFLEKQNDNFLVARLTSSLRRQHRQRAALRVLAKLHRTPGGERDRRERVPRPPHRHAEQHAAGTHAEEPGHFRRAVQAHVICRRSLPQVRRRDQHHPLPDQPEPLPVRPVHLRQGGTAGPDEPADPVHPRGLCVRLRGSGQQLLRRLRPGRLEDRAAPDREPRAPLRHRDVRRRLRRRRLSVLRQRRRGHPVPAHDHDRWGQRQHPVQAARDGQEQLPAAPRLQLVGHRGRAHVGQGRLRQVHRGRPRSDFDIGHVASPIARRRTSGRERCSHS